MSMTVTEPRRYVSCHAPPASSPSPPSASGRNVMTIAHTGSDVRKIGGRIGAEIVGIDLNLQLGEETVRDLNAALLEHKALFFRDQHLDDAGQVRFASYFGELTTAHPTVPSIEDNVHVLP